ncbi:hypothetical protein dsx2_1878 [Desulfovibrio sp. X2]|uniref:hypothetical protein n=1 Tax=Desulfovibrio sp. X2 TaxID=941449 RepID=UPI000358D7EF|nr:hypothetical protein [Desulfovibrio sp. X2]EPR44134.1 hypothetical protein dsx2_1878 [Desulfovibrio sp. X2]
MPQVAARISEDMEARLKASFRTKNAGAEFLLPWAMDMFLRNLAQLKAELSAAELKTVVEAYRSISRLLPEQCRLSYLQLRLREACAEEHVHTRHGASWPSLERKLERLSDVQAAALMVWAAAYWVSPLWKDETLDAYVRP